MPALTRSDGELRAGPPGVAGVVRGAGGGGRRSAVGSDGERRGRPAEPRLWEAVIEWSYRLTRRVEREEILLTLHAFKL